MVAHTSKTLRTIISLFLHSLALTVFWVMAAVLSNNLFDIELPPTSDPLGSLALMWVCCLLEVIVLHFYIVTIPWNRGARFVIIWLVLFLLQFGLTQVEVWFYVDPQIISHRMVLSTVAAGFIMSMLYTTLITFTYPLTSPSSPSNSESHTKSWLFILTLGILIYPAIYFTAGYFIAWQWEVIRTYYTGQTDLLSFGQVMWANFKSGAYGLQAFRGIIWTLLSLWILRSMVTNSWLYKGIIMGLLFAIIMNAQHLIPNPLMPDDVRAIHALETSVSNFVWGFIIVWLWGYWHKTRWKISSNYPTTQGDT